VDWDEIRQKNAARYSVSPEIHDNDLLMHFLLSHPAFPEPDQAIGYYFSDGAESARKLKAILDRNAPSPPTGSYSLLEFASGYGMVTRHLAHELVGADIVSCDIHDGAVDFINNTLHSSAVASRHVPEELSLDRLFDVVFALSFFSHMPEATFGRWLKALFSVVRPGGILAFTTHGLVSQKHFGELVLPESGFAFIASSEQGDLDEDEYGSSIASPDYVIGEVYRTVRAPICEFKHAYWWGHQDLYVVAKT
jgi:cyclopropane fatty-acyl-phospholipid synthase-like methyltransferase